LSEREALKEHPELQEAYKTMHTAATYFASKMPGKPEAQEAGIQSVMNHVQNRLNAGETGKFFPGPRAGSDSKEVAQPVRPAPDAGRDR
jgi:cell filamentation protein